MSEKSRKAFVGGMDTIGRPIAATIADVFDAQRFRRLLDIGGATGTYTIAFLHKNPHMEAVLFDLPPVVEMARERLQADGLSERVTLVPGDFYEDELPGECDLALVSAIIHQNSPAQNLDLYKKIFRALVAGGTILIRDHVMDETRTKPAAGALFSLNMLIGTEGGDTYTFEEIRETLKKAGFIDIKQLRSGDQMDSLVGATKPNA